MKLAIVVHDIGKQRGHDRYAAELARAMSERHEVHVFATTCDGVDKDAVTFHRVPAVQWPDLAKMVTFLISVTWMLRRHNFDVIHSQGSCSPARSVTTAHFCQAAWRRVYRTLDHGDLGVIQRWYQLLVMSLMAALEKSLFRRSQRLIALSDQVKNNLIDDYGVAADRVLTVYNGVNIEEFNPGNVHLYREEIRTELCLGKDDFVIGFVGEFKRKGLKYIIEALKYIEEDRPVRLLAVQGEPPGSFAAQAESLGVSDSVFFLGHRHDVNKIYATSDVVVFPTLYEPFGFTITEAMATGIPVITSGTAGAAELIRDGKDGFLLNDPTDSREIASKIRLLMHDDTLAIAAGQNGRKTVEKLSWVLFAEKVESVYQEMI